MLKLVLSFIIPLELNKYSGGCGGHSGSGVLLSWYRKLDVHKFQPPA